MSVTDYYVCYLLNKFVVLSQFRFSNSHRRNCLSCMIRFVCFTDQNCIFFMETIVFVFDAHCCHMGTAIKYPMPDSHL